MRALNSLEARGGSFPERLVESKMVRQDRLSRSSHSRRWLFDVVFLWKLKGEDYLKKPAAQKLFLSREQRVLAESLARGKIAVVAGLSYYSFLPFAKAGLPVKSVPISRDEIYVSGGSGNVAIIKGAPHPNAAKVFVNWFLGPEGQETYSRGMGQATRRLDVDSVVERDRHPRGYR
jgi:ABC-type Fe3+ transport system substrate-binding protein